MNKIKMSALSKYFKSFGFFREFRLSDFTRRIFWSSIDGAMILSTTASKSADEVEIPLRLTTNELVSAALERVKYLVCQGRNQRKRPCFSFSWPSINGISKRRNDLNGGRVISE